MKSPFNKAPRLVKFAAIAIAVYPVAISTYSFRLYAHPKNPDAWWVLGGLTAVYLLPAFLVLRGSNLARWFCAAWVVVNVSLGIFRIDRFSTYSSLQAFIVVCWVIQLSIIALMFAPSARGHFKKMPNRSPEPTAMSVTPHAAQEPRQP
jgi:hypothetical protein